MFWKWVSCLGDPPKSYILSILLWFRKVLPSTSNVVSWQYLTGRGVIANPLSLLCKKSATPQWKGWSVRPIQTWDLFADSQLSWCFSELTGIICPIVLMFGRNFSAFEQNEKSITGFPHWPQRPKFHLIYAGKVLLPLQGPADAALLNMKAHQKSSPIF